MSVALLALLVVAAPAPAGPELAIRAVPEAIDVSATETVELVAAGLAGAPGVAFAVEEGSVEELAPVDGALRARWTIPADLMPRRLAAAVVDGRTGAAAFTLLSVSRRARLRVNASPHARVRLRSSGHVVAEGTANALGKLELSVLVPPAMDLEGIEQELAGRSDAVRKLRELGLRNELHVFALAAASALTPDGTSELPLAVLAYSDDGAVGADAVTVATPGDAGAPAQLLGQGRFAAAVVAGPWRDGPPPASLRILVSARRGGEVATAAVAVPVVRLPPVELHLRGPRGPLEAGEVYEVEAVVLDAAGRVMSEAVVDVEALSPAPDAPALTVLAVGVTSGGGQALVVRAPREVRASVGAYTLRARVRESELSAELPLEVVAGPPASLVLAPKGPTEDGVELAISVRDRYGNPARGDVALAVTAGRLGEPRHVGPGELAAVWMPPTARRSAQATVDGSVAGTALRARTVVTHQAPAVYLGIGAYAGVASDGVTPAAPTLTVATSLDHRALPEGLGLLLLAGIGRGEWSQEVEGSPAEAEVLRTSLMVPVTAGVEWRWLHGRASVGVGVGTGVLVSAVSTAVREEEDDDEDLRPESTQWSAGWLWRASLRGGLTLGPGELSLIVEAWDAVTGTATYAGRPRAAAVGLGYVFAVTP